MLREVPFMDMSLLGGVGLGPNSAKPFWDQDLALLETRKCRDPLPTRAVLSWVSGWALPVGKALVPYTESSAVDWPDSTPLVPASFLARVTRFQPWGSSPVLCVLAPVEAEEPRTQASCGPSPPPLALPQPV